MATPGPRLTLDVPRPPCPRGHRGAIRLDGRNRLASGGFSRRRYRCKPSERDEPEHVFIPPFSIRFHQDENGQVHECPECEAKSGGLVGSPYFTFAVREVATALVAIGSGTSYRRASRNLRTAIDRVSAGGRHPGTTSHEGHLGMDYLDVLGDVVIEATAPGPWPEIIAIDSTAIEVPDHTTCCGTRTPKRKDRADLWGPPAADEPDDEPEEPEEPPDDGLPRIGQPPKRRPKIAHQPGGSLEIGRILVAVGYDHAGQRSSRPWLIRFAGTGDQASWAEFLRELPGDKVRWVVSDRDSGIMPAVAAVFPNAVHYFCEQHVATNALKYLTEDGIVDRTDPIFALIEQMQFGPAEFEAVWTAANARGLAKLTAWLVLNRPVILGQIATRREGYQRTAGGCEAVIKEVRPTVESRMPYFRNADRLNRLLALVRNDIDRTTVISVTRYSKILRDHLAKTGGFLRPDWKAACDPKGVSSMAVLHLDAVIRKKSATVARHAPKKAARYGRVMVSRRAVKAAAGMPTRPKRPPPRPVAGMVIADFPDLVAEWHETLNGTLDPTVIPAGGGEKIWWRCPAAVDHVWKTTSRSRTILSSGCPFCTGRYVAPSQRLSVMRPLVAAEWHPTRNGDKTPDDYSFAANHEAWWQCPVAKAHVYRARIINRAVDGTKCQYCPGGKFSRNPPPAGYGA